jgi:TonB family protein
MRPARAVASATLTLVLLGGALLRAEEPPLVAGSEGVPIPKKTKFVRPVYPPEAQAQGIRGIVILELVIDERGHVAQASVLRSIPGLDDAAVVAARQWEFEPVKVDGKPVSVRLTVPITFALSLPEVTRQEGIPELRQGVSPAWPASGSGVGRAGAEVTLESDGRIGVARIVEGESPWSDALLQALKTWRFATPPEDATLSFRVEAEFVPARGGDAQRVRLRLTGLQTSSSFGSQETAAAAGTPPTSPPAPTSGQGSATAAQAATPPGAPAAEPAAAPPAAQAPATSAPTPATPAPAPATPSAPAAPAAASPAAQAPTTSAPTPARPAPAPATPSAPLAATPTAPAPSGPTSQRPPAPALASAPGGAPPSAQPPGPGTSPPSPAAAPPPVEVITAPPPPLPPENGVSAIRDVALEPGVPDLTRGRHPVAPPLARLSGTSGSVEVAFSVSAAGVTAVRTANGPDLLKPAAEATVASWVFRRTRADRAYLVAVFTYAGDKASAAVRPQPPPQEP